MIGNDFQNDDFQNDLQNDFHDFHDGCENS